MLLKRLLWYYVHSDEFYLNRKLFLDAFLHCGECGTASQRFRFCSDFGWNLAALEEQNLEHYGHRMTGKRIRSYFSTIEDNEQLFAAIFSCMLGLSDRQISQMTEPRNRMVCWNMLDFFLRNPSAGRFDAALPQKELAYHVERNGAWEDAVLVENTHLRLLGTGELLEILP